MTEQEGELGLAASGLAGSHLTTEEGLAGQAHRLGRQHRSAAAQAGRHRKSAIGPLRHGAAASCCA